VRFIHTFDPAVTGHIDVVMEDETGFRVMASTETGQHTSGLRRKSSTYKWTHLGMQYRVQVQTTQPDVDLN
jgi:hypothetical protein